MKPKLPLLVERTLADEQMNVVDLATGFEQKVRAAVLEVRNSITCMRGCSNCCYHPFQVSIFQAIIIFRWLKAKARWSTTFRKKVEGASSRTLALSTDVWLQSMIPCVLLDEKQQCSAYDVRPIHCRVTFSTTPSEFCHPHNVEQAQFLPRGDILGRFHARERAFFKRHGLQGFYMPLSTALLIAEKIHEGTIALEDADMELGRMVTGVA